MWVLRLCQLIYYVRLVLLANRNKFCSLYDDVVKVGNIMSLSCSICFVFMVTLKV